MPIKWKIGVLERSLRMIKMEQRGENKVDAIDNEFVSIENGLL